MENIGTFEKDGGKQKIDYALYSHIDVTKADFFHLLISKTFGESVF